MHIDAITPEGVKEALRAVRTGRMLEGNPLLDLDAITLRLRHEGIPDNPSTRAWVLGRYLDELIWERLAVLRGSARRVARTNVAPEMECRLLEDDFRAGNIEIEAWGLMHFRYMAVTELTNAQLGEILGITVRTLDRRLERGHGLLVDTLREQERVAAKDVDSYPQAPARDRVVVERVAAHGAHGTLRTLPEALQALKAAIQDNEAVVRLTSDEARAIADHPVADLVEYRLGRVAEWSRPRYRLDERFVDLSLLIDVGEQTLSGRWQRQDKQYPTLREVLEDIKDTGLVLLGPPGSGKSTILRHFDLDQAVEGLRETSKAVTFFIQLNRYKAARPGDPPPTPREWLNASWSARFPHLPSLDDLLAAGRVVLLLDALNEMPHAGKADYRERILAWKRLVQEVASQGAGNRLVFSCRSLDYSAPLSSPALRVPQVQIELLSDEQVRRFLDLYTPARAESMWSALEGSEQLEVLRSPYFLKLLVDQVEIAGETPKGRAELFTGFVRQALRREIERDNPLFMPDGLVAERDYERMISAPRGKTPHELPERGAIFPALSRLAYGMQDHWVGGEVSQVRLDYDAALRILAHEKSTDILRAGAALGILDEDRETDEVLFFHQLLQEYFAARALAVHPNPALVRSEWQTGRIRPSVEEVIDALDPADPLPPLPQTGWEETALLAAAMATDPPSFLRGLMEVNLALAGRAAAQPELQSRLSDDLLDELCWALVARSRDPKADLRDRIACGLAVGNIGDPRFEQREGSHGKYLMPPLIAIPGGVYPIGDDEPIETAVGTTTSHMPRHQVEIAAFQIGQFPVTNAEWSWFIAGGGYEDERWWDTGAGRGWRQGIGTSAGIHSGVRHWLTRFRAEPELMNRFVERGSWDKEIHERWLQRLKMSEAEFDAHLYELYPESRFTEPRLWRDERFNHPSLPVVGICWYEARAYVRWLAEQTGLGFRLPTEVEWEAAARGKEGRRFAYGDAYDPLICNTTDTHVRRTTPIGVFPDSDTPEGVCDLTGNIWDWTSSAFGVRSDDPEFGYPYVKDDGREDAETAGDVRRVMRGGGWNNNRLIARAASRDLDLPDLWRNDNGLRVMVERPHIA